MKLTIIQTLIATLCCGIIIFLTRLFPFALFSKKEPPKVLQFIEKYIPSMAMVILLVYCLKDIHFSITPYGVPHFIALVVTIILHIWKRNAMISIFSGTILFIILNKIC